MGSETKDAFLSLRRPSRELRVSPTKEQRAHSKFSASGAERWMNCPGSVALSEGLPDKSSVWAEEGTRAHEVLERVLVYCLKYGLVNPKVGMRDFSGEDRVMLGYACEAAQYILAQAVIRGMRSNDVLVETRIYLDFIHSEMFGTFDGAVIDYWGRLDVFDYKYGAGHAVSPVENLQMIFYGLGLAARYLWDFKTVRLWIIQPRIKGYDGPTFWDLSMRQLRSYIPRFKEAVERVENESDTYVEGTWCRWCKAYSRCPLKRAVKLEKAKFVFGGL